MVDLEAFLRALCVFVVKQSPQMPHATCAGDDHIACHADEEAVFGDAGAGVERLVQRSGIGDGTEVAVEDDIALVGGVGLVAIHSQQPESRPDRGGSPLGQCQPKGKTSIGTAQVVPSWSESLDSSTTMTRRSAGLGDDFFPQQRAAAAFDHVEFGIDFIGAVDGQVDARMVLERTEANAESFGHRFRWPARWGWR